MSAQPAAGRETWRVIATIALAAGSVALVAYLVWTLLIVPQRADHAARQADAAADQYAGLLNARIAELVAQLHAAAGADSTVAALESDDPDQPALASRQLAQLLPFAQRVEIFRAGSAEVDLAAEVPITFAGLQIIRAAETEGFAGPEGIRAETGIRLIAARAVETDGDLHGVLFIAVSPGYLLQPLSAGPAPAGRLSLVQSFPGLPPLRLLEWGETGGAPTPAVQRELMAPRWTLAFEPRPNPATLTGGMFAALTALIGLALGGLLVTLRRSGAHRTTDDATLEPAGAVAATAPAGRSSAIAGSAAGTPSVTFPSAPGAATDVALDDDAVLDIAPAPARAGEPSPATEDLDIQALDEALPDALEISVDPEIFRAYDIRGIAEGNLAPEIVYWIGRAFAAEALDRDQPRVVVGRDGRHSSRPLRDALVRGLTEGGIDVLDAGEIPTPVLYYTARTIATDTGIMITGSHNPPEYNGLKMLIGGETLAGATIQALRERIDAHRFSDGRGDVREVDLTDQYLGEIADDVVVARPLKVVLDCGNGVASVLAPALLERLGCDVLPLYCDVDGDFPNHHPDPAVPANLDDLITVVRAERADIGIALDGDGDRIGVVTGSGAIIWPDRLLMLFAQDVVGRNPGADIIYDVKCSRHLNTVISDLGGRPIMWKTGHSHLKAKLKETQALLAGEFSGHICFGERWHGFDDALYAAARLLEIIGGGDDDADTLFGRFPESVCTPEIKVATTEQDKFAIVEQLTERFMAGGEGAITTIDGVRVDCADGWGLVRASNTGPILTLRFEADDQEALERIQQRFEDQLTAIDQQLRFR